MGEQAFRHDFFLPILDLHAATLHNVPVITILLVPGNRQLNRWIRSSTVPCGRKRKKHKIATHKRKKKLRMNRHKKK
jgi:hypothetical protein